MKRWARTLRAWWAVEVDLGHVLLVALLVWLVLTALWIGTNMRP